MGVCLSDFNITQSYPSTQGMLSCTSLEPLHRGSAPGDSAYSLPAHQGLNPTSPFRKSNLQVQTPPPVPQKIPPPSPSPRGQRSQNIQPEPRASTAGLAILPILLEGSQGEE